MAKFVRSVGMWAVVGGACLVGGCFSPDENGSGGTSGTDASSSEGPGTTAGPDASSGDPSAGTTEGPDATTTGGAVEGGELRLIHAAAGLGPVDVYLAGESTPLFERLDYADATDWVVPTASSVTFEVRLTGAAADSDPVYVTDAVAVDEGARINLIAAGELEPVDEDAAFRVLSLQDDWGASLAGRARGRLVHVGPDAPALTVDGVAVGSAVAPFEASDGEGFELDTAAGTRLFFADGDTMAALPSFTAPALTEGDEVLLVATGRLGSLARESDGFAVLAVGQEGVLGLVRQDPELFVLHGARDTGAIELCLDDTELAANLEYGALQSTRLSPGTYDVSLFAYPSGCSGDALNTNSTGVLEAGGRYLVLATGETVPEPQEAGIQVATFTDAFTLDDPGNTRVRFVHGASFTQVFVGSVVQDQISMANLYTDPIGWSDESDEVSLMAGDYILGVADANGAPMPPLVPLVTAPYSAVGGTRQWVIVAGDPTPDGKLEGALQALVVDTTQPQWVTALVDLVPPT